MRIRFWMALWLGKLAAWALKILGKKGTTFPGLIAQKVCPEIIKYLAVSFQGGTALITGTNGKTTTNNLLASIIKAAGKTVAFNREGANMLTGITGALLLHTSLTGKAKASCLILEVDEATVPRLCRQFTPQLAVVTNFFRDQLDRYGELDTTVKLVKDALPEATRLVLNADDPLVAQLGLERTQVIFYGAALLPVSREESLESREGRYCVRCGQELSYERFHYGQLGIYRCDQCGFVRPKPQIEAIEVRQSEKGISFQISGSEDASSVGLDYEVPLMGYYNLYNALAAFSAAEGLGISREAIRQGLAGFISDAGRMEQFVLPAFRLTLTLVKNPTGFNQVISTLTELGKPLHLLIAINDLAADGRDISWLWDVDFERLAGGQSEIKSLICSGLRAEDMALRLKYAGIPVGMTDIENDLEEAVALLESKPILPGEAVFILPTYTALFPMRDILNRKSAASGSASFRPEVGNP